jgi:hypothetical protein
MAPSRICRLVPQKIAATWQAKRRRRAEYGAGGRGGGQLPLGASSSLVQISGSHVSFLGLSAVAWRGEFWLWPGMVRGAHWDGGRKRPSQAAAPDEPAGWQPQHASTGRVPRAGHQATLGKGREVL